MKTVSLIFSLLAFYCKGQEKIIRGKITGTDNQVVAYASLGIPGTSYGTVTDDKGNFIFYLPEKSEPTDTLKISCIGFSQVKLAVNSLPDFLNVCLSVHETELAEVQVTIKREKIKTMGSRREATLMNCNFSIGDKANQNLGSEIGRKFSLTGARHYVHKLGVFTAFNFDTVLFRLNIYSIKNGLPYQNLLQENIIIQLLGPKKAWTTVDLKQYNLVFDQEVIVSLQWIGHSKKGEVVQLPIIMPAIGSTHYYKFGAEDVWKRYSNMSTSITLEVGVQLD